MWITIVDKNSEWVINFNNYQVFRKGKLCNGEPTIFLGNQNGSDLDLIYESPIERDEVYRKIRDRLGASTKIGA